MHERRSRRQAQPQAREIAFLQIQLPFGAAQHHEHFSGLAIAQCHFQDRLRQLRRVGRDRGLRHKA